MKTFVVSSALMAGAIALLPSVNVVWWSSAIEVRFAFLIFRISFLWCKDGVQK